MSEVPGRLRFTRSVGAEAQARIGVVDGAFGGADRFNSLAALFPQATFASAGATLPERGKGHFNILIASVDAASALQVDGALRHLKSRGGEQVVIVLGNADVMTTRRLIREGAADVLPAPPGEPALAACIERLLSSGHFERTSERKKGEVAAFLKAGGGVGTTALATQLACLLGRREGGEVCIADLDLQFGAAALYLDLGDAVTVDDVLGAGDALSETTFSSVLTKHRSGAKVLAGPRDVTPLEAMSPQQAEILVSGLRRDFALTLLDLPSVWTAWTNRVLQAADRIIIVTQLSVAHLHMVKRQLQVIGAQGLDSVPLVLVCNAVTADQQVQVSLKSVERVLGRSFDVVIPEDRRVMDAAINEGVAVSSVRRGTKLEKAIADLASKVTINAFPAAPARGLFR